MQLPVRFLEEMKSIVPDFDAFQHSYNEPPVRACRINNVKIDDDKLLLAMGEHERVPFSPHCYYLDEKEKWGNDPIHHAGLIYIQEPSAMAAVNAYKVDAALALDMCAAPGGKTIQLASKVDYLVSNEINASRA